MMRAWCAWALMSVVAMACSDTGSEEASSASKSVGEGEGGGSEDADADGFDASEDCDDSNPLVYPGADEVCNGIDDNCDSVVDTDAIDASTFYADADGDGFGAADAPAIACTQPPDTVENGTDCDDADASVNPDAIEVCDDADTDEDCNGVADDADTGTDPFSMALWFVDGDADSFGDEGGTGLPSCDEPSGGGTTYVADNTDCDDVRADIHPDAPEVCDERRVDENCNGLSGDDDPTLDTSTATTFYVDADGDGYGDESDTGTPFCDAPSGGGTLYGATNTDCDDTDSAIHPGADEICDDLDNDCDPTTSEDGTASWWDASGGFTDLTATLSAGTSSSPVAWTISDPGSAAICAGTWYTTVEIDASVSLWGPDGAATTILSGGDTGGVVDIDSGAAVVSLEGLTLTDGYNTGSGGGLYCNGATDLSLLDVVLSDNEAGFGGGLYAEDCAVVMDGVTVEDNTAAYGGGICVVTATLELSDSTVDGNAATYSGGGLYLDSTSSADTVDLLDSVITGNSAQYGGGFWMRGNTVTCTGSTSITAGIYGNTASVYGGGVRMFDSGGVLYATDCDFGDSTTGDDNDPDDLYDSSSNAYDSYTLDASFTCTSGTCF